MEHVRSSSLAGQWFGSYVYGPSYGEQVSGERVTFSFLLEADGGDVFHGKCIELEGVGASTEVSVIRGRFDGRTIRFTKEYRTNTYLDADGVVHEHAGEWIYRLTYAGRYYPERDSFTGSWAIREAAGGPDDDPDACYGNGSWEMSRHSPW